MVSNFEDFQMENKGYGPFQQHGKGPNIFTVNVAKLPLA